jgi:hypothetical protein
VINNQQFIQIKNIMENFKLLEGISLTVSHKKTTTKEFWSGIFSLAFLLNLIFIKYNPILWDFFGVRRGFGEYIGFIIILIFSSATVGVIISIPIAIFSAIFYPISWREENSYNLIYFEDYLLHLDRKIHFDQIKYVRYKEEASSIRVKVIEVKMCDDFYKDFGTANLILQKKYKKDVEKVVDFLNKKIRTAKNKVATDE